MLQLCRFVPVFKVATGHQPLKLEARLREVFDVVRDLADCDDAANFLHPVSHILDFSNSTRKVADVIDVSVDEDLEGGTAEKKIDLLQIHALNLRSQQRQSPRLQILEASIILLQ